MITLGTKNWGTGPVIGLTFEYEKRRSGTDMQYRVRMTVEAITGAKYFGYPIYLKLTLGGTLRATVTLKEISPSRWESAIVYTSDWYTVSNKTSGTTPVVFNVYSGAGSTRNNTYSYSLDVDPSTSTLSVANGTLGTSQTVTIKAADSTYKHKLLCICNDVSVYPDGSSDGFFTGTSTKICPPLSFSSANVTGTSVSVTFRLITYSSNGTVVLGTDEKIVTCAIPASVKPQCSISVTDPTGLADTYGGYVQGKSKMEISVSATLAYGSAIKSKQINADGKTYTKDVMADRSMILHRLLRLPLVP